MINAATECLSVHLSNYPRIIWKNLQCHFECAKPYDSGSRSKLNTKIYVRSLNRRGQVVWKASPQMLDRLADAEAEVEAEYQNER